jgi:hypothetical protein
VSVDHLEIVVEEPSMEGPSDASYRLCLVHFHLRSILTFVNKIFLRGCPRDYGDMRNGCPPPGASLSWSIEMTTIAIN